MSNFFYFFLISFVHCYHWTKEDEWSTCILLQKCQKHTYSPPQKKFNWLIGRRLKTISSNCCIFVRVGGLLTRQNILKETIKKHQSNLSIIDGVVVVGISADSYTAFYFYFTFCIRYVYLQTVDWKKPYFKANLLFFCYQKKQQEVQTAVMKKKRKKRGVRNW